MEIRPERRASPWPMTFTPAGTCSGSRRHADVISMFMSSSSTSLLPLGPRPKRSRRACACGESGKRGATAQPWPEIANVREKRGVDSDLGRLSDTCADKLDNGACTRHGASPQKARPVTLTLLCTLTFGLVHPAHARTAVGMAAGRFLLLLGDLGDQGFGGEQQ